MIMDVGVAVGVASEVLAWPFPASVAKSTESVL